MTQEQKKLKKIIDKDKELKGFKYEPEEIYFINRYITERNNNNDPFLVPKLVRNQFNILEIIYVPKKTTKEEYNRANSFKNISTFDGTSLYIKNADINSFDTSTPKREKAYKKAKKFIKDMINNKPTKGLYLCGRFTTGKTYLASAIAIEVAKYKKVLFVCYSDLVRIMKTLTFNPESEEKMKHLKRCDLLIIDDFGDATINKWFRDEVITSVLQYRNSASLPIILTSHFKYQDLIEKLIKYEDKDEASEKVSAVNIITKIKMLTEQVELTDIFK